MLFRGEWLLCDDRIVRPIIRGEILSDDGSWCAAELVVDTGADRTVLSANILDGLDLPTREPEQKIGGLGGIVESVTVETVIRLTREEQLKVMFRGEYAGLTSPEALDMSVLGRDILGLFAVIIDQPRDLVCMVGDGHAYTIEQA